MSLATFKKKSIINYGSNRSGKKTDQYFNLRGPFGSQTIPLEISLSNIGNGFSVNGAERNIGKITNTWVFSKNFTPYKGAFAKGNGGYKGTYYNEQHVYPSRQVDTLGYQNKYVKNSSLNTKGMLETKYRWINNGVYPNNIVSSSGVGNCNLADNKSQNVYIINKGISNDCVNDVNNIDKYIGYFNYGGPFGCNTANGDRYSWNQIVSNAPYTKTLYQPLTASQYVLKIQRKCVNGSSPNLLHTGNGNSVCAVPLSANLNY